MLRLSRFLAPAFLALALVSAPAGATGTDTQPTTVAQVVAEVEKVYNGTQTLKADFVQVTRAPAVADQQQQKGRVTIKRPRNMRWEFTSPENKLFVTNGQTIWIWSPKDNQVVIYKDFNQATGDMAGLLMDLDKLDETFDIQFAKEATADAPSFVLDLRPKKQGNMKRVQVTVSRKKFLVEHVLLVDQFDTETELTFSQVRLNPSVTEGEFTFTVPTGAQVFSPEGM